VEDERTQPEQGGVMPVVFQLDGSDLFARETTEIRAEIDQWLVELAGHPDTPRSIARSNRWAVPAGNPPPHQVEQARRAIGSSLMSVRWEGESVRVKCLIGEPEGGEPYAVNGELVSEWMTLPVVPPAKLMTIADKIEAEHRHVVPRS
jgi:hypothetical protein